MKTLILIILLSFSFGSILNVPDDFGTIQTAIDAAIEGDTVVVYPGLYEENILIDKSITLTSLALFDTTTNTIAESLDDWYDSDQYVVTDENINSTIIDGSGETKSTITIASEEDICIEPLILGFTIQDGSGTLMDRFYDDPDGGTFTIQQYIGGGILSYLANPTLHYNKIQNNGKFCSDYVSTTQMECEANNGVWYIFEIKTGSAIYPASSSDDIDFIDRNTQRNSHCENDVLDFTHNFFENNFSSLGRHIGNRYFEGDIDLSNCVFDYWNCEGNGDYQTPIWVNIDDLDNLVAEDEDNSGCLLTGDVYVDPGTGNDDLNDGLSWESPFYTITNTLPKVVGTPENPVNIYLAEGTYSPSTNGESFPIEMFSFINLIGQGEEVTILDAEQTDRVILMGNCRTNIISSLTITGADVLGYGGGMDLSFSDPILTNLIITDNDASKGGGIYLEFSNPTLTNVKFIENTASTGGGMFSNHSNPILTNVTLARNNAGLGGALYLNHNIPILTNVTITENTAQCGSGMFLNNSDPILKNSIIWNNFSCPIYLNNFDVPLITYSNIEEGWEGEGNIDQDPLFTNSTFNEFSLQLGSPCIDSGDPEQWYQDLDETRSDMGSTGGLFLQPNFTQHNFGEVGTLGSTIQFKLENYRETNITISQVNFETTLFTTNVDFPIVIESLKTGIINIHTNNNILGFVEDSMILVSPDLPEGLSIGLSTIGVEGNVLNGNLTGIYPSAVYRITGDLTIGSEDIVVLEQGTEFLFDGSYIFNIYGILLAQGTETDSIIFDKFGEENWKGINLVEVGDETIFKYVKILGASGQQENQGIFNVGGMNLYYSNPILKHVTISNNGDDQNVDFGGGMYLFHSNPILTNVKINRNFALNGGGMYLYHSNPILKDVNISWNSGTSGINLAYSNPILTNVLMYANSGLGIKISSTSNPILTNVTISNNGGGIKLTSSELTLTNSIIWDNGPESIQLESNEEPLITFSDIEGGWDGVGNIDQNPLFIDTTFPSNNYTLHVDSPCIDAGTADLDGDGYEDTTDYCGSAPDMGAYEYITEDCEECGVDLADVNGDGEINILDLVQIVNYILDTDVPAYECAADYNQDGEVNILDLVQIVNFILEN